LDVYQRSIEFFALSAQILEKMPRGNAMLKDQLKRAGLSIPLNIAEGVGKVRPSDKKRFFAIARGSAGECGAVLDACLILGLIEPERYNHGKSILSRIVAMLTKMCWI